MKTEKVLFSDIEQSAKASLTERIGSYSVALLAGTSKNVSFVGSATLVRVGDRFGLLTAEHVVDSSQVRSADCLGLNFLTYEHRFKLDRNLLTVHSLGTKPSDTDGPDCAFVEIPAKHTGWIQEKKAFYWIDRKEACLEQRLSEALPNLHFLSGTPQQFSSTTLEQSESRSYRLLRTTSQLMVCESMFSYAAQGIDYYDVTMPTESPQYAIRTYKGVSGGGLWQTRLRRKSESEPHFFEEPYLVGLAFYQLPDEDGKARVRCQGYKSITRALLSLVGQAPIARDTTPQA